MSNGITTVLITSAHTCTPSCATHLIAPRQLHPCYRPWYLLMPHFPWYGMSITAFVGSDLYLLPWARLQHFWHRECCSPSQEEKVLNLSKSRVFFCCSGLDLWHKVADGIMCVVTLTLEEGCASLDLIYTRRQKKEQQKQLSYQVKTKEKPRWAGPLVLSRKTVETTVFLTHLFFFFATIGITPHLRDKYRIAHSMTPNFSSLIWAIMRLFPSHWSPAQSSWRSPSVVWGDEGRGQLLRELGNSQAT